eukprot:gene6120-6738_t
MQFTPQQLAGGPKFSPVTRIGNWQEELAMEEAKVENFQQRSATGSLSLRKLERKMAICTEIVPHSFSPDGFVRFGDSVILRHDASGSVLACDPFEQVPISTETFTVSTIAEEPTPKARNCFRISRPPKRLQGVMDSETDPVLYVGQPFVLTCNESLLVQPNSNLLAPALYLASTRKSERTASKRSNRQMAYMTTTLDADAIWCCVVPSKGKLNGSERFLAIGTPVSVSTSYQLTHRQTNMFLTCDPSFKIATEFGIEYECYADRSNSYGKIALMVSEYKGLSTSQTLTKPDAPTFSWHFVTASDERRAIDSRQLPTAATPETVVQQLHDFIRDRGLDAFWNLRDYLHEMEKQLVVAGKVDREDLREALVHWGVTMNKKYLDMVLDQVDSDRMGLINVKDFLRLVRGPLPPNRSALLKSVFALLDAAGEGTVPITIFQKRFNGQDHPLVSIGGFNEQYALEHFLRSTEVNRRLPSRVTFEMFADYYGDLSAAVEDDSYFESIVRSNWA